MSRETFEAHMEKRMKDLKQSGEHSIFHELQGRIIDYDYDKKSLSMVFEATEFHKNGFGIMFGGSLVGMFDIAFGTLTAGLGDYDIAPTAQLSVNFLKGIPVGAQVVIRAEAVSVGKTLMNFMGKAYVEDELAGSATGTFMTPRPFKIYVED